MPNSVYRLLDGVDWHRADGLEAGRLVDRRVRRDEGMFASETKRNVLCFRGGGQERGVHSQWLKLC